MKSIVITTLSGALGLLSACGGSAPTVDRVASSEDALSARAEGFVTVRRDLRKCARPLCGGYWVTRANREEPEQYVNSLDLLHAGLDAAAIASLLSAPESELLLRGRLGEAEPQFSTRPLIVSEAYRGLPGASSEGGFFQVTVNDPPINCIAAPCPNGQAGKLNRPHETTAISAVSAEGVNRSFVDTTWLVSRVEEHGAIAQGELVERPLPGNAAGPEITLEAANVYVRLPEAPGPCPMFKLAACPEGQVQTYTRNENRCEFPAGCVEPGACTRILPLCDEDYSLVSWTAGPNACQAYACDPTFSLPAAE